jgi:hypothetical protein
MRFLSKIIIKKTALNQRLFYKKMDESGFLARFAEQKVHFRSESSNDQKFSGGL